MSHGDNYCESRGGRFFLSLLAKDSILSVLVDCGRGWMGVGLAYRYRYIFRWTSGRTDGRRIRRTREFVGGGRDFIQRTNFKRSKQNGERFQLIRGNETTKSSIQNQESRSFFRFLSLLSPP